MSLYFGPLLLLFIGALSLVVAVLITGFVRELALSHGVLDVPNERSSHTTATPRGGGLSIVISMTVAVAALASLGAVRKELALALLGGGLAVAIAGFMDDRFNLPVRVRLAVHVCAATLSVYCLGGLPPLQFGIRIFHPGWMGFPLGVFAIVWTLNLFNFMDGIDGIAASEAMFVAFGGALLTLFGTGNNDVRAVGVVAGAASCGFLLWNWPPAKIFMGDVGSGYIGFVAAVLALAAGHSQPFALWVWLILGGVFFVDATVTLLRRAARGARIHEAHRSHAYQWLARRWGSHRRVTLIVMFINMAWLLPCAIIASLHPSYAATIAAVALAPLVAVAIAAGAGRPESHS